MKHDETKLPKWAQIQIANLRREIESIKKIHAILSDQDRDWFQIRDVVPEEEQSVTLWILRPNTPTAICSLGKEDMVFIGRAKK